MHGMRSLKVENDQLKEEALPKCMMASVGCKSGILYYQVTTHKVISACMHSFESYQVAQLRQLFQLQGCVVATMNQDNEASHNVEANHHLRMSVGEFLSPNFNSEISFLDITNMQLR